MRKCIILSLLIISIPLVSCTYDVNTNNTSNDTNVPTQEPKLEENVDENKADESYFITTDTIDAGTSIDDIDTNVIYVLTQIGYNVEQSSAIQKILNNVGVYSIEVIRETPDDVTKGLAPIICLANGEDELHFWFTTEDGVLFYCGFRGENLYDSDNGGYLKKITDVHIPETEITLETYSNLQLFAEENVRIYLNNPNNAHFNTLSWGVGRSDEKYKIIGKVTASNSFGFDKEMNFSVWFIESNNSFDVEAIIIDNIRVR